MSTHDAGQDPHEPDPYGSSPYGSSPYGPGPDHGYPPPQYGQPGPYGAAVRPPYASWGIRLGAYLLDTLLALAVMIVPLIAGAIAFGAGSTTTTDAYGQSTTHVDGPAAAIGIVCFVLAGVLGIVFQVWNFVFRQGRRTQSLAKEWLGIAVVREADGQPIGAGAGFGRWLMHSYVDTLFGMCIPLGFLWPLWDARKRTWGDMAVGSIVIRAPRT